MEEVFGGAGAGALSGAGIGAMVPVPGAPLIGAGAGALIGGVGGWFKKRGRDKQKKSLHQARSQLEDFARAQREARAADLQRALGYFQPVQDEITRLYGG